jgi:O-antigen ligase
VDPLTLCTMIVGLLGLLTVAIVWSLRDPQRAFLLVIFSTPFVVTPSHHPFFMRVGLPEIVFTLFVFVWLWSLAVRRTRSQRIHPIHLLNVLFLMVAAFSFVGANQEGFSLAVVEVVILGYLVLFCLIADQFIGSDDDLKKVLDIWMLAAAVVAVVGLYECLAVVFGLPRIHRYRDAFRVIATFRRPPQLGVYALSTFFVALAYSMVPELSARRRTALRLLAVAMVVLIVFSSRRSALGALAVGMFLVLVTNARHLRRALVLGALFIVAVYGTHYLASNNDLLQTFFSKRLKVLYSPDLSDTPFIRENIAQAVAAFRDEPFLGIGYGHFATSEYSNEAGNEIHSTPLRVLAECGIAGSLAYLLMTGAFLYLAWRNIALARGTIWASFMQVLFPGLLALQVSYLYNRALRDRTYWLTVALVVALNRLLVARRSAAAADAAGPQPALPEPGASETDPGPPGGEPEPSGDDDSGR